MKTSRLLLVFFGLSFLACQAGGAPPADNAQETPAKNTFNAIAVFAGGCFWCTEAVFERVEGVSEVLSGYAGGKASDADYGSVSAGITDHAEAIEIYYDSSIVSYNTLLEVFFKGAHDATQVDRQGPDKGRQYRSAVFYRTEDERKAVEAVIKAIEQEGFYDKEIATEVVPLEKFYAAEAYHQDFYERNPSQGYVVSVSKPKVKKFEKLFPELLKKEYK